MLLTNRRHRLIHFCLAGMEIAWIAPIILLLYPPFLNRGVLPAYGFLLAGLLGWMIAIDLINRFVLRSPQYELIILCLIIFSTSMIIRLVAYAGRPFFDLSWILDSLLGLVRFEQGFPVELMLILLNLFLWLRATNATSRDLDFWSIGLNFRLGMLLLIAGGAFLYARGVTNAPYFLWLYFTFGLTTIALARIDEKSIDSRSMGGLLPTDRLIQLLLTIVVTLIIIVGLSSLYTPTNLRAMLLWLGPIWQAVAGVVLFLFSVIFWIIGPILLWVGELIVALFNQIDLSNFQSMLDSVRERWSAGPPRQNDGMDLALPAWVWTSFRYLGLGFFLLLCLGLVFLFLDKVRPRSLRTGVETTDNESLSFGGNTLMEMFDRLKETAGLLRQYGLSRQLLAAISVENIYANICRLARQHGRPRHRAQPPDDYLPILINLYNGQAEAPTRITTAYMQVHYGGKQISRTDLDRIRQDYSRIRALKID
jgi:hypothetical protein